MLKTYLTGQLVIVYKQWLGRVTNETDRGVWVCPLIKVKPDCECKDQDHHACYAPHNVKPYLGRQM